ncbi:mechanosensitive ion channel MScS [Desulfosarcina variabilis str. Montpellier]|uniref:mechanosensitive ion channel domain-containing protein n=1 Tax=Desulfosarcina variabilis TaxID=2300 RepID=UPI003AFAA74A
MHLSKRRLIPRRWGWLLAILILFSYVGPAHCEENSSPASSPRDTPASGAVSLADVVYKSGTLGQQLDMLKRKLEEVDSLDQMADRLKRAKTQSDQFQKRLDAINADDLQSYQLLASLKSEVRTEAVAVERVVETLTKRIQRVEEWRKNWITKKQRWQTWRASLDADPALKSIADALDSADGNINQALDLIGRKLEPMLLVQQQAGETEARVGGLISQIDSIMVKQRGGTLRSGTSTIFSLDYLRQLIELTHEPEKMIGAMQLPEAAFFASKGWVVGLQVFTFVALFSLIRRHRPLLLGQANRRFLGKRPFSASLFISIFTLSFFYTPQPEAWRMLIAVLACIATGRMVTALVQDAWVKRAITILVVVVVVFQILLFLSIPLALMRLFLLVWTVAGIIYFGWRARQATTTDKPPWQVWGIRLIVLAFAVIAVADIIGFSGFAVQLMDNSLRTAVLLLMGVVMIRVARMALEMAAEFFPMGRLHFLRTNANVILSRLIIAVNFVIVTFVAAHLLVAWRIYAFPTEAIQSVFGFGIGVGGREITVGLVLTAGLILYGTFAVSWAVQSLLMENVLSRGQMDTGARLSITRLVHYALILVGFLIALSAMGFELKNVTIIGGALGVGIGFGMQAIVNNFVSGLILLFERPIKVGDVIQLGDGQQGRVTNLGLRATTVQTFDRAEIVVPNGDLISSQVTNWTLEDRSMRLIIPVGVAYGSDVEAVMRVLLDVARQSEKVLKEPPPVVLFLNFGDSSLDFQLRVWIADFAERRFIQSTLIQEIDRRFRTNDIEIPFPQRDLHLRSVDDNAGKGLRGETQPLVQTPIPQGSET